MNKNKASSTVISVLIILVAFTFLAGTVTMYATNITLTRSQQEQLRLTKQNIWVYGDGTAFAAISIENMGGRDVVIDKIQVQGVEVEWSTIYYLRRSTALSNSLIRPRSTYWFDFEYASGTFKTFTQGSNDLLLASGDTMVIYIISPGNIGVDDLGKSVDITVFTANAEYSVECTVKSAETIDIYGIAYSGDDDHGFLKTVEIATNGIITNTIIDSLEFDTVKGKTPCIIHVSDDIYAIAYTGDHDHGFLKTVRISSNGQIGDVVLDTLEFDAVKGKTPHIIYVSPNIYAIAYSGDRDRGFLKTVEITRSGQISDTVLDTLEFDAVKGKTPYIIHVSGEIFAIVYSGAGDRGFLKTVQITATGQISDTVLDTLNFDAIKGKTPHIIHVSSTVYATAYSGNRDHGFLKTVEITTDGIIADTVIDTLEFDAVKGKTPRIIHVSNDIYAIAYSGDGDDGFLKTVEITATGQINDTILDTLEFDAVKGKTPTIIHVSPNVYAIAYSGDGDHGYLKTVKITSSGQISDTIIDSLEFDAAKGKTPCVVWSG